jgi:hypothetical protein
MSAKLKPAVQNLHEVVSTEGYHLTQIVLPPAVALAVQNRNWIELDQLIAHEVIAGGVVFEELRKYSQFSSIEFIISIRSSLQEPDDDGIWHDDGSRLLAFSLSLTIDPNEIEGGVLEIRKRSPHPSQSSCLSTPLFGTMIVFATGQLGFEHKINKVTQGERIIIAGWCT